MDSKKAHIKVILDKRRQKKSGLYPLKLRVTFNRERRYHSLPIDDLSEEDWNKLESGSVRKIDLIELKNEIKEIELKGEKVAKGIDPFRFQTFEKLMFTQYDNMDVYGRIEEYRAKLRKNGKAGTESSYKDALNSFKKFSKKLTLDQVTVEWLQSYETWMTSQGRSKTTVGFYLRNLRNIYNEAIEDGAVPLSSYPFGKRKYQIPKGKNIKKALTKEQVDQLAEYECNSDTFESFAKDYWMFSYLCGGINLKDIARLKFNNIDGDTLRFMRKKTESTSGTEVLISAPLHTKAKEIIERIGNKRVNDDDLIFPILKQGISPEEELAITRQFNKQINKYMKRIGEDLNFHLKLTFYVARHTFSTILKRKGYSTEMISEALGHTELKTTSVYLDSFEDSVKREYVDALL